MLAQVVKNPAMQDPVVWSPRWEDPLEEGMAAHCRILAWRESHGQRNLGAAAHGAVKSWTQLSD